MASEIAGIIKRYQEQLQKQFVYVSDEDKNGVIEKWESEEELFLKGKTFYGDCDTYALTGARAIAKIENINEDDILLFDCNVGRIGHLISGVLDRNSGETYIMDNRFKYMRRLDDLIKNEGYVFNSFARLSNITKWWKLLENYPYDFRKPNKRNIVKINWDNYKNFSEVEFRCKCGCGKANMNVELIDKLQRIRTTINKRITIVSGFRCKKYNKRVGGKKKSAHLLGEAVDIAIPNSNYRFIIKKNAYKLGINRIGDYRKQHFIHLDVSKSLPQNVEW